MRAVALKEVVELGRGVVGSGWLRRSASRRGSAGGAVQARGRSQARAVGQDLPSSPALRVAIGIPFGCRGAGVTDSAQKGAGAAIAGVLRRGSAVV